MLVMSFRLVKSVVNKIFISLLLNISSDNTVFYINFSSASVLVKRVGCYLTTKY